MLFLLLWIRIWYAALANLSVFTLSVTAIHLIVDEEEDDKGKGPPKSVVEDTTDRLTSTVFYKRGG